MNELMNERIIEVGSPLLPAIAGTAIHLTRTALASLMRKYVATLVWLWALCCGKGVGHSASERRSSQGQGQGYSAAASSYQASFSAEPRYFLSPRSTIEIGNDFIDNFIRSEFLL